MSDERLEAFCRRILTTDTLWGLRSAQGWAVAPSNFEDADVLLFWSSAESAERCARDEWSDYAPSAITLEDFVHAWLPGMVEQGHLAGPDWRADLTGGEYEPDEIAACLNRLLDEET